MDCVIATQITNLANSDTQACIDVEVNEQAIGELFITGEAEFSNGEVELWETVDKAFNDEQELVRSLVLRVAMDDLEARTELRLLLSGIAAQQNLAMANSH